jgi:polyisoprenyl-teichoic acid--peptidoglycan teichoic acid transferase
LPEARPAAGIWKRLVAGALLIVAASTVASAAFGFNELDKIVRALGQGKELDVGKELALAEAGAPQTIMLIGSDRRNAQSETIGDFGEPRSDTVILVRLDPKKGATALMSLPRDLEVDIPGYGTDRLNAAYELGGPKLTLKTVKELTGLRINHVVEIDFTGFIQAVDELGCVYVDVDRSYYSSGSEYAYINLHAGYQQLCGDDALAYVRFRHEDNDLVRGARQHEFLRQAKEQITFGSLYKDRDALLEIFGNYTDSDIHSRADTLELIKLAIASAKLPVREVHFEGTLGPIYVTASDSKVKSLTQEFLGVEETKGPRGGERVEQEPKDDPGGRGGGGKHRDELDVDLDDATAEGEAQAQAADAETLRFPVFYPTEKLPGSTFSEEPSVYRIQTTGPGKLQAYRMVLSTGITGEYYGLQGTAWTDPPILERPDETRTIDGREYELHFDGDRLRLVAWRTDRGSYWVSNTLLQSLSEEEMLGIAVSAREL